jgi:hypothetical protein
VGSLNGVDVAVVMLVDADVGDGTILGSHVGDVEGTDVGWAVGNAVGTIDGTKLGDVEGDSDGADDGVMLGSHVGNVDISVGEEEGWTDVGSPDGDVVVSLSSSANNLSRDSVGACCVEQVDSDMGDNVDIGAGGGYGGGCRTVSATTTGVGIGDDSWNSCAWVGNDASVGPEYSEWVIVLSLLFDAICLGASGGCQSCRSLLPLLVGDITLECSHIAIKAVGDGIIVGLGYCDTLLCSG